jgi:hypothetical protein
MPVWLKYTFSYLFYNLERWGGGGWTLTNSSQIYAFVNYSSLVQINFVKVHCHSSTEEPYHLILPHKKSYHCFLFYLLLYFIF